MSTPEPDTARYTVVIDQAHVQLGPVEALGIPVSIGISTNSGGSSERCVGGLLDASGQRRLDEIRV
jgi:hypothetical protein